MDLSKQLDDLFQSISTSSNVDSNEIGVTKRKKASGSNKVDKSSRTVSKNSIGNSSKNEKKIAPKKTKELPKPKPQRTMKFSFECVCCFKTYKTEKGYKNHKCADDAIDEVRKKRINVNGARATSKQFRDITHDDQAHLERSQPEKTSQQSSATTVNPQQVNGVDEYSFKCIDCSEMFMHRRAYLHHIKKLQCKKKQNKSLHAIISDIYREILSR